MKTNYKLINNLRDKIDIVTVLSEYISLTKKGNNFSGLCPFHSDTKPSLIVSPKKKIYKCFSCNNGGDVFTFVKNYEKISYFAAAVSVAKKFGTDSSIINQLTSINSAVEKYRYLYDINQLASNLFSRFLNDKLYQSAKDYLIARNISAEIIDHFHLGYAPIMKDIMIKLLINKDNILKTNVYNYNLQQINEAGLANLDINGEFNSFFIDRIIFPIFNENNDIVAFSGRTFKNDSVGPKYLNTGSTPVFNKNAILYNLNNVILDLVDCESIYVVEGFMDLFALYSIGIKNVVATMGVAFSSNHLDLLTKLPMLKNINLAFDNDLAGQLAVQKTAELIKTKYSVYVLNYDTNLKDLGEIYDQNKDQLVTAANNLISYTTYQIKQLISSSNFDNQSNISIFFEKAMLILKNETNELVISKNLNQIAALCKLDYQEVLRIFENQKPKTRTSYHKNYDSNIKNQIAFNKSTNNFNISLIDNLIRCELSILRLIVHNRECYQIFVNELNYFSNINHKKIYNIFDQFYKNNPDSLCINIEVINKLFSESSIDNKLEYITMFTNWINDTNNSKHKPNYFDSIHQSINTYNKLISKKTKFLKE